MLHANVFVLKILRYLLCLHENLRKSSGRVHVVGCSAHLRELLYLFLKICRHGININLIVSQELWYEPVLLHEQSEV